MNLHCLIEYILNLIFNKLKMYQHSDEINKIENSNVDLAQQKLASLI